MKIIKIEWLDATSVDDWQATKDIKPELSHIITIGHLVLETPNIITVALSYDKTNECVSNFIHIPKAWIKSKKLIK